VADSAGTLGRQWQREPVDEILLLIEEIGLDISGAINQAGS